MVIKSFFAINYVSVWLILGSLVSTAQSIHQPQLHIRKAEGQILLDGLLDEKDWSLAEGISHFYQIFPTDTAIARSNTVVKTYV